MSVLAAKADRTPLAQWMMTGRGLVGDAVLDRTLERAPRDVHGAGDGSLLVLVGLAHVEHDGAGLPAQLVGRGGVDLSDLGLGGGEQLTEARHRADPLWHVPGAARWHGVKSLAR